MLDVLRDLPVGGTELGAHAHAPQRGAVLVHAVQRPLQDGPGADAARAGAPGRGAPLRQGSAKVRLELSVRAPGDAAECVQPRTPRPTRPRSWKWQGAPVPGVGWRSARRPRRRHQTPGVTQVPVAEEAPRRVAPGEGRRGQESPRPRVLVADLQLHARDRLPGAAAAAVAVWRVDAAVASTPRPSPRVSPATRPVAQECYDGVLRLGRPGTTVLSQQNKLVSPAEVQRAFQVDRPVLCERRVHCKEGCTCWRSGCTCWRGRCTWWRSRPTYWRSRPAYWRNRPTCWRASGSAAGRFA